MARYSVIVTRDTTESTEVEIEAESDKEAEAKAREYARNNPNLTWERDDTLNMSSDPYTNGADLTE